MKQPSVEATIPADTMCFVRLVLAGKTVHISLTDDDLFLSIVDVIDLTLGAFCELANLTDHQFKL